MKPVIGISTRLRGVVGSSGVEQPTHTVARLYSDAVHQAGGLPLLLPPQTPEDVEVLLDRLDGLVLSGGGDVAARLHGRPHHETMYDVDDDRDAFEVALVLEARRRGTPLLAICRGMQVVNVTLGGNLLLDIPSEHAGALGHYAGGAEVFLGHQRIELDPGSRLAGLLGVTELLVNSMHHQAVQSLGTGLRRVGWADDGITEALEPENGDWALMAVQWHPECLASHDPHARRLFEALIEAAGG